MSAPAISLAHDQGELVDYPISCRERLDSHYFLQWNLKRWRGSEFRKKADPEVGWFGFHLFCIAQDGSPIGTLPCDDQQLAFDLNLPLERWQALLRREVNPLWGWYKVRCDNGEVRLGHKVVTEVAEEALKSKRLSAEKRQIRRDAKRLKDLRAQVEAIGASQLLRQPGFLERLDAYLTENHEGNRTEAAVRAALDEVAK